jgi:hypothetical protein
MFTSKTEKVFIVKSRSRLVPLLAGLMMVFYLVNGIFYIRSQSMTADEGSFVNYAIRLLKGHPDRIYPTRDNSKMPVSVINLIPRGVNQLLHPGLKKTDNGLSDILAGRYITLLVSLVTLLLIFKWTAELYGRPAALFAVFLTSFSPDIIANAGLVTTDSYSALALLATMYCLWKCCRERSARYFVFFTFSIAFSQLVKQSLSHVYVLSAVIFCVYYFFRPFRVRWQMVICYGFFFMIINWLVINLGFYFRGTNTILGYYHFSSTFFQELQNLFPARLPVPFPRAFVTGLDMAKYYDQIGGGITGVSSFGKVTILGHASTGGSFWYYYFVSLFFKIPVSQQIFIGAAVLLLIRHASKRDFMSRELFLAAPVVYFLLYMSFLYKTQCGVRQIIFIYPLLFIFCGSIVNYLHNRYMRAATIVLSGYLVVSVMLYWSNYYPYTNEYIADKKMAFGYVGAANLEFQQGNYFFWQYLKQHPEVKMAGIHPEAGIFLINVNDYLDVWNRHRYDWIGHIKPFGQVAFNGLLIRVTSNDIDLLPGNKKE